jgi:hypothetical protein
MKELEDLGICAPLGDSPVESPVQQYDADTMVAIRAVSGISGLTTATTEKALNLLGSGVNAEQTASALGVTPARISQLLAEENFAGLVAGLRYKNLQKHNVRDNAYDSLEDKLLAKLEKAMPLLIKPESILKAISVVNNAKRRGQSAPQQANTQLNIVTLVMPNVIAQRFAVDINNQVTKAGEQNLLTMQSGNLLSRVEAAQEAALKDKVKELTYVHSL